MKKEKSVAGVVTHHIVHTTIIFPFFGLLVAYFVLGFLGEKADTTTYLTIRDLITILFFFFGVKYSLSYIDKKMFVKNVEKSLNYSVFIFSVLIIMIWMGSILQLFNIVRIGYNTMFFGTVFILFFLLTKRYFLSLKSPAVTE